MRAGTPDLVSISLGAPHFNAFFNLYFMEEIWSKKEKHYKKAIRDSDRQWKGSIREGGGRGDLAFGGGKFNFDPVDSAVILKFNL